MQLTLDSSEPLEDAMRVVGALYAVTLAVSANESDDRPVVDRDQVAPERTKKPVGRKQTANRAAGTGASARAGVIHTTRTGSPRPASSKNAEVRSWARESGLTISDRGRIPASVIAAYRDAHAV
jgi:hypothetical protein